MVWRLLSVVWIAITLVINIFAVTALFDAWEIHDTAWKPELYNLGVYYMAPLTVISSVINPTVASLLPFELPCWWVHLLAIYATSASAIWAGTMSVNERNERIGQVARGSMSIIWPLAIVGLITEAFRNRIVTNFFRQHTATVALYTVAVFALYAAANFANTHLLDGEPVPCQETSLANKTPCDLGTCGSR